MLGLVRSLCRLGAWFGGILYILSALLITVEIVLRKFFNLSTGGSEEIPAYGLAIASAWTYGFALIERGHVRVDIVYARFPPRVQAFLDIAAIGVFLFFFALVAYYAWGVVTDTIRISARSRSGLSIPLAIPQSIWLVGLALTVAVSALLMLKGLAHLMADELGPLRRLIGPKSADEEIEDEMEAIGKRPVKRSEEAS